MPSLGIEKRVSVIRKLRNAKIESFLSTDEIGANMSLGDFQTALSIESLDSLALALSEEIGNPTFILTKKSLYEAIKAAGEVVYLDQINLASDRVIGIMKDSTVSVAGLKLPLAE